MNETPLDLQALYRQQTDNGYTHDLILYAHQAQQLATHLRGLQAVTAVLIADTDGESLHLGRWLRAGLLAAVHSMVWSATGELETANERAQEGGAA